MTKKILKWLYYINHVVISSHNTRCFEILKKINNCIKWPNYLVKVINVEQ